MKKIFTTIWVKNFILITGFVLCISYLPIINSIVYAEPIKIVVLPFEMNSGQNLDFLKNGIQDMLSSRLSFKDDVKVIEKEIVYKAASDIKGFSGESFALLVGGKLNADFVIYGSVTVIGNSTSIDSKLVDVSGKNAPISFFKQSSDPSGVIPAINQFAATINETILNRSSEAVSSTLSQPASQQLNHQPIESMQQTEEQQANQKQRLNPNFLVNSQSVLKGGKSVSWKSQVFKHLINGIAVGNINKDNFIETIFISDEALYIYRFSDNRFVKIEESQKNRHSTYIGVGVGDINKNGIDEIFITSLNPEKNMADSFVMEFDGTKYVNIIKNSKWYFKVIETKNEGTILLGQKQKSEKNNIYDSQIYKMIWNGENYIPSEAILESGKANVLGSLFSDILGDGTSYLIAYDKSEHLTLFNKNGGAIWRDVNKSGGNMNYFNLAKQSPTDDQEIEYFPLSIKSCDINGDGTLEILYALNSDIAGGYLSKFRRYSKGTIHCSFWNSTSLSLEWSTPEHTGRISDFVIGDFDNDGVKELVIANVIKDAFTSFSDSESIITAYELMQ